MKKKEEHQVVSVALAYIRCSCGWENRLEMLIDPVTRRRKSDEDLALETGMALVEHQRLMSK